MNILLFILNDIYFDCLQSDMILYRIF